MSNPVNKVKFQQFRRQAQAHEIQEVHVNRVDKRDKVILRYNGKTARGRQRITAEWSVARGERDEKDVDKDIKEFLKLAREHFFVHRGEGLGDKKYADAKMEKKGTPIVAEDVAEDGKKD